MSFPSFPSFFVEPLENDEPIRQRIFRVIGCDSTRFPLATPCFLRKSELVSDLYAGFRDFLVMPDYSQLPTYALIGTVFHNKAIIVIYERERNKMWRILEMDAPVPTAFCQFSLFLGKMPVPTTSGERCKFIVTDVLAYNGISCASNDAITRLRIAAKVLGSLKSEWLSFEMIPAVRLTEYKKGMFDQNGLFLRSIPNAQLTGRSRSQFVWGTSPLFRARLVKPQKSKFQTNSKKENLMLLLDDETEEDIQDFKFGAYDYSLSLLDSQTKNSSECLLESIVNTRQFNLQDVVWCEMEKTGNNINVVRLAERQKPHSTRYVEELRESLKNPVMASDLFV